MLSLTVEYALRAMMQLAALEPGMSVNSEGIAEQTRVPRGYLSKVLRDLVLAGLVVSQRGPNGGFALARPARDITMLAVINAVDPIVRITTCPLGNAGHQRLCPLHAKIDRAIGAVECEFRNTTLAEVVIGAPAEPGIDCQALVTLTRGTSDVLAAPRPTH